MMTARQRDVVLPDCIQLTREGFYGFSQLQVQRVLFQKKTVRVVEASGVGDLSCSRVAVKEYAQLNSDNSAQILNEITILHTCHHPNIMQLQGAVLSTTDCSLSIIMPLCSRGTLSGRIRTGMDVPTITRYFTQVACALRHLHLKNIVHGDVKPANILIDDCDNAVLTDFDHATILSPMQDTVTQWGGTFGYIGPEALSEEPFCPYKVRQCHIPLPSCICILYVHSMFCSCKLAVPQQYG